MVIGVGALARSRPTTRFVVTTTMTWNRDCTEELRLAAAGAARAHVLELYDHPISTPARWTTTKLPLQLLGGSSSYDH
jgi:hypothetical protein